MKENCTKYFSNCKAVFQGGGCKGIAYIGAYRAAYERGVFFSELAGTSAGSIIAALIAAGATPDKLEEIVGSIDFNRFMRPVGEPTIKERISVWALNLFFPKTKALKKYRNYLSLRALETKYGVFDSEEIESFVEESLQSITGRRNVTFSDIIPDLHIVCCDIITHRVKIWNRENTPNELISKAVRSSCSIPVFFSPTDERYVDGGMLSNLPGHIFSEEPHYNKILCFSNSGESEPMGKGILNYISSLVGTIIDGAVEIQKQYVGEAYDVIINTGNTRATDFTRMQNASEREGLIKSGEDAMNRFLDDEYNCIHNSHKESRSTFNTEEMMHSMVAELSMERHDEICVVRQNTYWAWVLFLSVVKWINDGTVVRVVVPRVKDHDKHKVEEESRRRMLSAMGCHIIEDDSDNKVDGFFFKSNNIWTGVLCEKTAEGRFSAKFYKSMLESRLLASILSPYVSESVQMSGIITLKQNKEEDILDGIKRVAQYRNAKLYYKTISLESLVFLNQHIRALKYRQIQLLFDLYRDKDLNEFSSSALVFPNTKESLVGPPVVELRNGKYYLIEGNTRCVFAFRHGIRELKMVVAEDVSEPLPCSENVGYRITEVLLSDKKLEGETRYDGFEQQRFRHIEAAIRPNDTYMK